MAIGYTRQSSYVDGDTILAEHTNNEYNLLQEAFDDLVGHNHDGTTGGGAPITVLADGDRDTTVQVENLPDEDKIHFNTGGAKKMTIDSNGILIGDRYRITYNVALDTLDIGVE